MADKKVTMESLNAAAKLLLDQMSSEVTEILDVLTAEYRLPHWQLICGILMEAHTTGHLSAFTLDPAWQDGFKQESAFCPQCKKVFTPVRLAQKFCSNECGNKADIAGGVLKLGTERKVLHGELASSGNTVNDRSGADPTVDSADSSAGWGA